MYELTENLFSLIHGNVHCIQMYWVFLAVCQSFHGDPYYGQVHSGDVANGV